MSSIELPDEILCNILGRLPVQDLIRYRCVCKTWCLLISNPDFISTHLSLHENRDGYVLFHRCIGGNIFSLFNKNNYALHSILEVPFSCETVDFRLAGCVDGLLCLTDSCHLFGRTIYLWNPSIWKLKVLRDSCFARQYREVGNFFVIGFGFHHQTNDYKIVRIMYFGNHFCQYVEKQPPKVEVYSLARNSWRSIGTNGGWYTRDKSSTVVVNGALHWFASKTADASADFVLKFDFSVEEFGEILLPNYHCDGKSFRVSVTVLKESLALIVCCLNGYGSEHCDIWVMREYGVTDSWTKQYSVVTEEICYRCLGIVNNNVLLLDCNRNEFLSYDLEKLQVKPIGVKEYLGDFTYFTESLVLYNEGFSVTPRKYLLVEGGIHLGKRKRSVFELLQKKWL
ncbi:hypothetical protein ACOSQ2_026385 [Xanthoceras sorbifolium]